MVSFVIERGRCKEIKIFSLPMMVGRLVCVCELYMCMCVSVFTHVFGNLKSNVLKPPCMKQLQYACLFFVLYHCKSPVSEMFLSITHFSYSVNWIYEEHHSSEMVVILFPTCEDWQFCIGLLNTKS